MSARRDANLYVIATNRVLRYDGPGAHMGEVPQPTDLTAAFALPAEAHHGWKFASSGPDGRLYMNVGVPCNIGEFNRDMHALIISYTRRGPGCSDALRLLPAGGSAPPCADAAHRRSA